MRHINILNEQMKSSQFMSATHALSSQRWIQIRNSIGNVGFFSESFVFPIDWNGMMKKKVQFCGWQRNSFHSIGLFRFSIKFPFHSDKQIDSTLTRVYSIINWNQNKIHLFSPKRMWQMRRGWRGMSWDWRTMGSNNNNKNINEIYGTDKKHLY